MNPTPDPLDERLARLRTELQPPRDPWPSIRARLGAQQVEEPPPQQQRPQRPQRPRWLAPVALAASVALVSLLLGRREAPPGVPDVLYADHPVPGAIVAAEYERLLPALAPETRQRVEQALQTIRDAEAQIVSALAEDPGNPLLLRLRQRAAQREIDLMTTVTRDAVAELPRSET
jgi:hypothetical protein